MAASITLKKHKVYLEISHGDTVLGYIHVHESNKTVPAALLLRGFSQEIRFKRIYEVPRNVTDESIYNKEEFNK